MTYRDEAEALRAQLDAEAARSEELRAELTQQRERVAHLEKVKWNLTNTSLETSVPGELSVEDHPEVAAAVEAAGFPYKRSTVGRTLVLSSNDGLIVLELLPQNGETRARLTEQFRPGLGAVYVVVGGAGLSAFFRLLFEGALTFVSLLGTLGVAGLTLLALRVAFSRHAKRRVAANVELLAAVESAVKRLSAPKVRVAASDEGDAPESSADEARPGPAQAAPPRK
jgi:hypothetical protein